MSGQDAPSVTLADKVLWMDLITLVQAVYEGTLGTEVVKKVGAEKISRHREQAEAENAELAAMLKTCFDALVALPESALGFGSDDAGRWPIRDELISNIDALLAKHGGAS